MKISYSIEAVADQYREAVGGEEVEVTFKTGRFHIPHPLFISDEQQEKVNAASGDKQLAIALMGVDQYKAYHELGGRAGDVVLTWRAIANTMEDQTGGVKPVPTRS